MISSPVEGNRMNQGLLWVDACVLLGPTYGSPWVKPLWSLVLGLLGPIPVPGQFSIKLCSSFVNYIRNFLAKKRKKKKSIENFLHNKFFMQKN